MLSADFHKELTLITFLTLPMVKTFSGRDKSIFRDSGD